MINNQYKYITEIYSHLMDDISYSDWADYIYDVSFDFLGNNKNLNALELGAGTCKLAIKLLKYYPNVFVSDLSFEMVNYIPKKELKKVCCDMSLLPFKKKFDLVFSAFDSVNYLSEEKKLLQLFIEVERILSPNGIFTFDVSLEKNSCDIVNYLNRSGFYNGIKFKQISKFDEKKKLHTNKFILSLPNGKKVEELHEQRIYPLTTFFELAENAGLYVAACYETFLFEEINENSERAQFIMKKKN